MPEEKKPEDLTPEEAAVALEVPEEDKAGSAEGDGSTAGTTSQAPAGADSASAEGAGADEPQDPAEKRIKDAQSKMHEKAQEAARVKEENRVLKEKISKYEAPTPPPEMTQDELDQLLIDNPKAYAERLVAVEKYKVDKEAWEQKEKDRRDAEELEASQAATQRTLDEFIVFSSNLLGVEGKPGKSFKEQPKEIQELYGTKEFQAVRDLIDSGERPELIRADGSVSRTALRIAWEEVNPNYTPPAKTKAQAKKDQLNDLKVGSSALSRTGSPGDGTAVTPIAKLTPAQIANLPPEKAEAYLEMEEEEA